MFVCIVVVGLSYFADVEAQGRPGWAGYEAAPALRGWLGLRREPRDWSAAAADCLREEAALLAPWGAGFAAAAGALAARDALPMLYSGARVTLPYVAGGAGAGAVELERCAAFLSNGSSTEVACSARLPYVCYAADPGPASRLWPGYEYSQSLRGWLKLHSAPRDWHQARLACHLEGAFLSAPWSPEFVAAVRARAARVPARAVHAAVTAREDYADAVFFLDESGAPSARGSGLQRRASCLALLADGSERQGSCDRRLPFVCYAPAASASTASALDASPGPALPTSVPIPTIPTVPTTSPGTITHPTSTPTPIPTIQTAAPTISTAVPTTSTTTLAPTTKSTPVPATSTALPTTSTTTLAPTSRSTPIPATSTTVPTTSTTTLAPTTRSTLVPIPTAFPLTTTSPVPSTASSSTAAPFNVCEEMGLAGYSWEEVTDQCYRFHPYGATWPAANATCAAEGAALAVANSEEEAALFARLLRQHLRSGIRDAGFKGAVALGFYWDREWKTVDGAALEASGYAKWWPGWPSGKEVARWGFMEHTGRLENYSDVITTPFICEAPR